MKESQRKNTDLHSLPHHPIDFAILGITILVFSYLSFDNIYFLVTFSQHRGYESGVFGNPIPIHHSIFFTLFWTTGLVGSILLLIKKKFGWVILHVILLPTILFLILIISIAFSKQLVFQYGLFITYLLSGSVVIYIINRKKFKARIDGVSYKYVFVGVVIVIVTSILFFDIFSFY
jgi:hypothetical protein